MDHFGIVGLSWRQGGPAAIARFTLSLEQRASRLPELAESLGVSELVYLATCNRVEFCFVADSAGRVPEIRRALYRAFCGGDASTGEAERSLRAWAGEGAVEHLFLVATGLDSAQIGESEVAGQLREALGYARELGLVGPRLGYLLESALKVSRRTRHGTGLGSGRISLAEIALDSLRRRGIGSGCKVALVGLSAMTERCARSLVEMGTSILVLNRTASKARRFAGELGPLAEARALDDFLAAPEQVAAILSATGAPDAVFRREALRAIADETDPAFPLLIDFAVPPDFDVDAARGLGLEHIGMEQIIAEAEAGSSRRVREMAEARANVDEALESLRKQLARRAVDAAAAVLQRHYQDSARESLEKLLRRDLQGIGERERGQLQRWAESLARRFAHIPSSGLREIAYHGGQEALTAFFAGADEELALELEEALRSSTTFAHLEAAQASSEDGR